MNELFNSKVLKNNFTAKFEFRDFKARSEKHQKRAPFDSFKSDN